VDQETYTLELEVIDSERKAGILVQILKFKDEEKY
jgi:hypothetical protein